MLPPVLDWIALFVRMSGKSVLASTSMTPHAWFADWPASVQPIALRTPLRAPSAPMTYLAWMTRSTSFWSPDVWASVTRTGCSASCVTSSALNS